MKRYLIFGSAGLGLLMYSIDSTAVAVASPHRIQDLHTNVLWAGRTVSIYFYINLPIGIVLISLIRILLHDGKVSSKPNIDFARAAFENIGGNAGRNLRLCWDDRRRRYGKVGRSLANQHRDCVLKTA
ncbi:MAG: hypothetical protein NT047_16065 [Deltaproteobacteria bacterium]|nr:hypothetical protein [Deltaproteobacteria bacterium]